MPNPCALTVLAPPAGRGPVTVGIPFPKGALPDARHLALRDPTGAPVRLQARALAKWADGSVKWALLDWIAAGRAYEAHVAGAPSDGTGPRATVEEFDGLFVVNTGAAKFEIATANAFTVSHNGTTGEYVARDGAGIERVARVTQWEVEEPGPLRLCVRFHGHLAERDPNLVVSRDIEFDARLHFWAGTASVKCEFTLRNTRPAAHPGGLWDLGDPGSVLLKDAALVFACADSRVQFSADPGVAVEECGGAFELYQDSSGGENWRGANHLTANRTIPTSFRGYRLRANGAERTGLRATPVVALAGAVGVAVPHFWQNFPMAIEADGASLALRFFPQQFAALHELQPGEQKTHAFALGFGRDSAPEALEWFRHAVCAHATPEWYCASGAVPYLTPRATDPHADYLKLVDAAIEGPDSFDAKREVIDEYGWRHFGEIYGDHEAAFHTGSEPLVSHYNNQYDPVAGFAVQFMRSGDSRWLRHMAELAAHVVDIDVYHTQRDKSAYNGGLFWHTYHYAAADTATHRSYPKALLQMKGRAGLDHKADQVQATKHVYAAGGGPANEHNYATGLMLCHFLTGSAAARDTALGLARWVIDMDDGNKTVFKWLCRADTGRASMSRDEWYHGPGRGSGNSLSALLDGHQLSGDPAFMAKAEQLIRRVIHPADDVTKRNLLDVENRWFYTMFLHALGKYLDHKAERGELDFMYAYARASLLRYAEWMAEHEVPTLSRPEKLEYPNETWAAQDMRKAEVFRHAARHATGAARAKFRERAGFFFTDSVARLTAFPTRTKARPVVLLLSLGHAQAHAEAHPEDAAPAPKEEPRSFGAPEAFVPQKVIAKMRAKLLLAAGAAAGALALAAGVWLLVR